MKTQAYELCSECRNVTWNGSRLEVIINIMNGYEYRDKSDDEVNSTIFMMLTQCMSMKTLTCNKCRLLVLSRLPGNMYGSVS
jgi:hypothetical protein